MRILIAEDDYASRKFMIQFLAAYGDVDVTIDGEEAVMAYQMALDSEDYYQLVCLDIMMPHKDGQETLQEIRRMEEEQQIPVEKRAKVIMTTALSELEQVNKAFDEGCQGYAAKPLDTDKFLKVMKKLGLPV